MSYFISVDMKISERVIELISRSLDLMDQPVCQPVRQSVPGRRTDFSNQSVSLSLTGKLTSPNDLFHLIKYKNQEN